MKTMNKTLIIILLLWAAAPASAQVINKAVNVNGVSRLYLVYLPGDFSASENMPAMFHFHGGNGSPQSAIQFEDYRDLADQHRFVAVYPAALLDPDNCTCWNGEGPYDNGIDELGFADAMINAVVADYNVDPQRIYASGFSLGGSLMWDYACLMGDRFAAVGVVAANMWEWTYQACGNAVQTNIIHILGTEDFYAPYVGNQYSISVAQQNMHWVDINETSQDVIQTSLGNNVTQYFWPEADACHSYTHLRIQNGGHEWPSLATQTIWDYVSQYDTNGLIDCNERSCPGDLTGDDLVDVADFSEFLIYFGQTGPGLSADLDGDEDVDIGDFSVFLVNFGNDCNTPLRAVSVLPTASTDDKKSLSDAPTVIPHR